MRKLLFYIFAAALLTPAIEAKSIDLDKIMVEGLRGPVFETAQESELKTWAQEYVVAMSATNRALTRKNYLEKCSERLEKDPYCQFMADRLAAKPVPKKATPEQVQTAARAISSLELEGLPEFTDLVWQRAIRKYSSWGALAPFVSKVQENSGCYGGGLYFALALKAEEYFPADEMRAAAIALNAKVVQCEKDSILKYKAMYRRALFLIWDDRCEDSEKSLQELVETGIYDYAPRALYWQYQCALKKGQTEKIVEVRDRLLKKYPLSYHGLFLNRGVLSAHLRLEETGAADGLFRSSKVEAANLWIRASEILHELKRPDLSQPMLTRMNERFPNLEPSVRLYLSALLYQSKDYVGNFRILSQTFRDDPSIINRKTLQFFYPLTHFDAIQKGSVKVSGDPFLFAALIRQESGFNVRARSPVGAIGLMQLMPTTAKHFGEPVKARLYDPENNLRVGMRYFTHLMDKYQNDAELSLIAYNAGPMRVEAWQRRYPTVNRMLFLDLIPFSETRDYVALISRNYYWYRALYLSRQTRQIASTPDGTPSHATQPTRTRPYFSLMSPN